MGDFNGVVSPANASAPGDRFRDIVNKVMDNSKKKDEEEDDDNDDNDDQHGDRPKVTPTPSPLIKVIVVPMSSSPPPTAVPGSPLIVASASPQLPGSKSSGSSNDASTKNASGENKGGSSSGVAIGVGVIACLAIMAIAMFVVRKRRSKQTAQEKSLESPHDTAQPTTRNDTSTNYSHMPNTEDLKVRSYPGTNGSSTIAEQAEIQAVRIPMEKIEFGQLLSRGGFGEVYRGTYKGEPVAIKRLLPERRKDMRQIDAFLSEAKMMATLEHERVVKFVGVAWDSLSEVCVVLEFLEGGDLRSVLSRWETTERRLHGFDHDKIKIALHVAHAMTYLHSMQPVILHRDLKSKNILLNHDYDAKVTDFGVSRESIDATMTAGVGSSLWMAPEVMMGERYDVKADVFSFGVILSELDTHLLPYSHATEPGTGRKIPDTAILQMVTLGRLTVEFTSTADPELVALGRDCVALDPKDRPTAGEVLHRVHTVWRSCVSL